VQHEDEVEYPTPDKYLVDRDAILFNRLSIREAVQWSFFVVLVYLDINYLPLDITYKFVIASFLFVAGYAFVHQPFNGLTGYEWARVAIRFSRERDRHQTPPASNFIDKTRRKPTISVSVKVELPTPEVKEQLQNVS
jgi:hypothetical protein